MKNIDKKNLKKNDRLLVYLNNASFVNNYIDFFPFKDHSKTHFQLIQEL